jgi:2-desacetyl-2-hydroxyethyl bacteriochlorophyllide A dehydrogenase
VGETTIPQGKEIAANVSSGAGREALSVWFRAARQVELRSSPTGRPGPKELLIEALFSAISHGTEMLVYRGEVAVDTPLDLTIPTCQGGFGFPIKYGYASVGRVAEAGAEANVERGAIVFAFNPHETCYTIPAEFVLRLPAALQPLSGVLAANLETAVNALLDAAPRLGETVVITGQGVIGLLITWLARKAGAGLIITADQFEKRRRLSQSFGADLSVECAPDEFGRCVTERTSGRGADVVIEASGQPAALDSAIKVASVEGRVVVVSWYGTKPVTLSLATDFHRKRLTLRSSQVSSLDPSLAPRWSLSRRRELAVGYLAEIPCDQLISHIIPFDRAAEAYRLIDQHPGEVVQVVLDYGAEPRSREGG